MRLTPKRKAYQLYTSYLKAISIGGEVIQSIFVSDCARQCALRAVTECIELHFNLESDANGIGESFKYWLEVKEELEKL